MFRDIPEKVSYLHGLSEGLNINDGGPQGKIIAGILDVLDEMSDAIHGLRGDLGELQEYLESMDDDLWELQDAFLGSEVEHVHHELECAHCGAQLFFDADLLEDDDIIEIICPECNEVVYIHDGSFDYHHGHGDEPVQQSGTEESNPSPS